MGLNGGSVATDSEIHTSNPMQTYSTNSLKVVGNEKVGGSGICTVCHTVPIWLGPRRSRFVSLSTLPSSLILFISVNLIFLISREVHSGAVANSYVRKCAKTVFHHI